ncbi:DUF2523 family protein [Photobacterium damselae]|uniref:DUF2523 family protein n=1 Tax=Photobacterium damselae TaxID=38293 RepID=UPI000D05B9C5|nr:DUF2523 family protein [Photobacterium damselae]ELV7518611.1 DUF2523 domain-containing protein [Photobacterium damselae]MBA5684106.1 DUF2523 domain-containing protein [Photobacterium damselae subsp. damselae]MBA5684115.1 DUF2523 domain-containing protein [Photobacterium damselae subsp. damselae]PSB82752.1 hypothetical protein C5F61_00040 [Photobacterium damselae subsp. damselae]
MPWLNELWTQFLNLVGGVILTIFNLLYDFIVKMMDLVMTGIGLLIKPILSMFSFLDLSQYLNGFPAEAINILSLVGFPLATSMICTALLIRFLLQLIPFVRLGS